MLNKRGFTLAEILAVISIILIITAISTDFLVKAFRSSRFISEQDQAVTNARRAINIIKKEIRGANSSDRGDYPLNLIDNDEFIFFSDINSNGVTDKVRYFVNGTNLIKEVTQPGALNDYSGDSESQIISQFMNNAEEDIFVYFDRNYNETSLINEVRLIKVILKINVTPNISPNDYYVETDVTLRNLKDNL